jgi:small multidrug resistance family-3 protein
MENGDMGFPKLTIFGFLILATALEVFGDAVVRIGLGQQVLANRLAYFAAGAVLLFGYGLSLNTAPIEFEKVVGVYIATLFVMWQLVSFLTFRTVPSLPTLAGGALIIAGGLVVAFWHPASLGQPS